MKEKTKVYIYTRVSTAVQVDGYSLDAQKSRMKAYAEFNDFEIVGEYEDAGKSGKSIEGRLEFNRMMEDIKSGKDGVSYVLVFKLSRFGRNAADVLSTLQVMQDFDVNLICVEDGIDSSKDAVMLCITMLGVMSMWTGLMNIAKKAGIIDRLTKGLRPVLAFLFPTVPGDHPANEYIAANIISNVLGLGWAATPMGLKAMEQLAQLNHGSHRASTDMCTFLIINISSLQLIPVNIIAYRSQYGSVSPTSILGMGLAATLISVAAGVLFATSARILAGRKGL